MSLRTPLTAERVAERLADTGWSGDTSEISRTFAVEYDVAMKIVAEVARVAIEMEHRPDIDIRWDRLRFAMTTHTAGDVVTELDFAIAEEFPGPCRAHLHHGACVRWTVHSGASLYQDPWLDIRLSDVEITGGRHLQHRVMRTGPGAGAVVWDKQKRVLLLWRHRFITDAWGWEIPMGGLKAGEELATAAAREVEEETGWRPGPMRPLTAIHPSSGISESRHHIFLADGAEYIGPPAEDWEAERVEWVPLRTVPDLVAKGEMPNGTSMAALLYALIRND